MISSQLAIYHPSTHEVIRLAREHTPEGTKILSDKLKGIERSAIQRALAVMFNELYDFDLSSLKTDIAKILLLDGDRVVGREDRVKLLRAFWWVASVYFEGDTGKVIQTCNDVRAFTKGGDSV